MGSYTTKVRISWQELRILKLGSGGLLETTLGFNLLGCTEQQEYLLKKHVSTVINFVQKERFTVPLMVTGTL